MVGGKYRQTIPEVASVATPNAVMDTGGRLAQHAAVFAAIPVRTMTTGEFS